VSEDKRQQEDIEEQLLQRVAKLAQQTGSALKEVLFMEIIRGLRSKGIDRVLVLSNVILLFTKDEREREEINRIKLMANRLLGSRKAEEIMGDQSIILPDFAFTDVRYLEWLDNMSDLYIPFTSLKDEGFKKIKAEMDRVVESYKKLHPEATNREIKLIMNAYSLRLFNYPPLEVIFGDFCVWAENILLQKIARILEGGESSEVMVNEDKVASGI
jgi:hypothetical protein